MWETFMWGKHYYLVLDKAVLNNQPMVKFFRKVCVL